MLAEKIEISKILRFPESSHRILFEFSENDLREVRKKKHRNLRGCTRRAEKLNLIKLGKNELR